MELNSLPFYKRCRYKRLLFHIVSIPGTLLPPWIEEHHQPLYYMEAGGGTLIFVKCIFSDFL